jgi:hypothetical protein
MTNPTLPRPTLTAPPAPISINDNLPSSSPSPRNTLIGFGSVFGIIALFVLYWKIVGF